MPLGTFYKTYKGIDLTLKKYVTIYIKPVSHLVMLEFEIKNVFKKYKGRIAIKNSTTSKMGRDRQNR